MKHRLYVPELAAHEQPPSVVETLLVEGDRAHYLNRVLRLKTGAELGLLDGRGRQWRARLADSGPKRCELELSELMRHEPAPTPLILGQAILKGSAMDTVVQKAVELGATAIWLVSAERGNVKLDERRLNNKLAHLERIASSAMEQCESVWLPQVSLVGDLAAALDRGTGLKTILLDLEQPPLETADEPAPLLLLVGPEGGWSEAERRLIRQHPEVSLAGLGALTLRAETAPLAALAAIRESWGWRR